MEGAGIFTIIALILVAPFEVWQEHTRRWRQLDEVEKSLRRASHGFALAVLVLLAFFYLYGARGVGGFLVALVTEGKLWPGAVFVALIAYGLVRFIVGARRSAGVRDGLRASSAFVKLALGLTVAVYLWRASWPWVEFGGSLWGAAALAIVFTVACLYALTGAVRFLLLTVGGSNALTIIKRELSRRNAPLRSARRRPWWKLW